MKNPEVKSKATRYEQVFQKRKRVDGASLREWDSRVGSTFLSQGADRVVVAQAVEAKITRNVFPNNPSIFLQICSACYL